MTNVLIRGVPPEDLDEIRSAAVAAGTSVQGYLRDAVHAQAVHLRRRAALDATATRLRARPAVLDVDRAAVLDAIHEAHVERAEELDVRAPE